MMFGLKQERNVAACIGKATACFRACIAHRDFGANFGGSVWRKAKINAAHIGCGAVSFIMDRGAANRECFGFVGNCRAATSVGDALASAINFKVNDDELRIKQARPAQDWLTETQRS